jgi:hypothetical protein
MDGLTRMVFVLVLVQLIVLASAAIPVSNKQCHQAVQTVQTRLKTVTCDLCLHFMSLIAIKEGIVCLNYANNDGDLKTHSPPLPGVFRVILSYVKLWCYILYVFVLLHVNE